MQSVKIPTVVPLYHLPNVPEHLLTYDFDFEDYFFGNQTNRVCVRDGNSFVAGRHRRQEVSDDLKSWLKDNIISNWHSVGFGRDVSPCNGPHVDRSARYKLLYLIEPGGESVETVFWQPKSNLCDFTVDTMFFNNYDNLERTETHILKPNQWVILYGSYHIHSVENITGCRVTLQLGLHRDPVLDIN